MSHSIAASLLLGLMLVACGGSAGPSGPPSPNRTPGPTSPATPTPPPTAGPTDPEGGNLDEIIGDWRLVAGTLRGQPIPIVADAPITLSVNAVRVGGTSACNEYGAEWVFDGGGLRLGDITMTLKLCEEPVNASEIAYLEALGLINSATLDGEQLVLDGQGSELRFERTGG